MELQWAKPVHTLCINVHTAQNVVNSTSSPVLKDFGTQLIYHSPVTGVCFSMQLEQVQVITRSLLASKTGGVEAWERG